MHSNTEWIFLPLCSLILYVRTEEGYLSEILETKMSDPLLEMHSIYFLYLATLFTWHL